MGEDAIIILIVNHGSSILKFGLYQTALSEDFLQGEMGTELDSAEARVLVDKHLNFPDQNAAIISKEGPIPVQVMKTNEDLLSPGILETWWDE